MNKQSIAFIILAFIIGTLFGTWQAWYFMSENKRILEPFLSKPTPTLIRPILKPTAKPSLTPTLIPTLVPTEEPVIYVPEWKPEKGIGSSSESGYYE